MNIKNKLITKETILSELVLDNYLLILVLERFGVALGQHSKTIEIICTEKKISINAFLMVINLYNNTSYNTIEIDFSVPEIKTIIKYLTSSHQYYSKEIFPEITKNIQSLNLINKTPEASMVVQFFNQYKEDVDYHFYYEDNILFPYILKLLNNETITTPSFSLKKYKEDHDDIEEKLDEIKRLLIQYLIQKNDTVIRRKLLFDLFLLEQDLKIHDYIEDNILVPYIVKRNGSIF